ncbi:hypothetical protein ASPZODRAFT_129961 [Penicilliopsis zonata CBS 506.65]|uniref:Wax synthase domain-containing protein n=1 Tax=Penicilliopsis zonata CBS 506.65 TaxID=1073090 RepID=A0A1L9SQH9_9EURO|nr:hypothetical protein ASPZODRAFT_129961 [Penicilliopsis zonata CBS 506.65]OJJ49482.1 hypothetical protein ASPZODRAFT_129961 [Penicilliopsis zonata CBS 506.65]
MRSLADFCTALRLLLDLRAVGTRWQAKNTPPWPSYFGTDPNPPSQTAFVLRQAAIGLWEYLLLDLIFSQSGRGLPSDDFSSFSSFINPTHGRWQVRLLSSLAVWLVFGRTLVDVIYRFVSMVAVLSGLTMPDCWPPFFGSMWDAYTLRNAWGKFWHQQFRWPFTTFSSFVSRSVLHLPRHSRVERSMSVLLAFLLSGLMHHVGSPVEEASGAIPFFTVFAVGMVIEDELLWRWRCWFGRGFYSTATTTIWERIVGFVWVSVWLAMVAPWYTADIVRVVASTKTQLPVSLVDAYGLSTASVVLAIGAVLLKVIFKTSL